MQDVSKPLFAVSVIALAFGYGVAVGHYEIFPYEALEFAKTSLAQVYDERETLLGVTPVGLVEPARYAGDGVTRWNRDRAAPGLTLLSGFFDDALELRLVALDGTIVRRWPARLSELFPDTQHIQPPGKVPQTDWNTGVQGMWAFPDGSVIFNFEGMGSARLDRCGAVQWTLPRMTHHSIAPSADGSFWIPGARYVQESSAFPGLVPPYEEDTILKVSPDGAVIEEISVLDVFFRNGLEALLFANGMAGLDVPGDDSLTHLNDVEELLPALAPQFPEFAAGDLLISLRNYNLVMVVDPRTRRVKWHQTGPWLKQHDPDFEPGGHIVVFSNNTDGTDDGSVLGGSTLLDIQPHDRRVSLRYGRKPGQTLFTKYRGKHQRLQHGGELLVESHAGRVIEVDAHGEIVWEFVNRYREDTVTVVTGAIRYDDEYFAVRDWACE